MKHTLKKIFLLTLTACGLLTQTASALVTIDSVYVGNIGNAADPTTGYGSVNYGYSIGKYEVTLNQYTEFLNAVAKTDTYGLYNQSMGNDSNVRGISRSGVSGSYSYSVSVFGGGLRPVTYVSWYDSARFVNWLHNGQPVGAQAAGTTETGVYTLTGNSGIITRNLGWLYSLPSEDEWYKAAYHQPETQGGDADNYWLYPTANNAIPNSRNGSLTDPNSGNFKRYVAPFDGVNDGYAVSGSTSYSTSQQYLTSVGAFSLADSFYGTFDQGGNVWEWNDAEIGSARGLRGGAWNVEGEVLLRSEIRGSTGPTTEASDVGFRVAIVPEPSVAALAALGAAALFRRRIAC